MVWQFKLFLVIKEEKQKKEKGRQGLEEEMNQEQKRKSLWVDREREAKVRCQMREQEAR